MKFEVIVASVMLATPGSFFQSTTLEDNKQPLRVSINYQGMMHGQTSIPAELDYPHMLNTTGQLHTSDGLKDLVSSALSHVEAMAFLPIDHDADRMIDRQISDGFRNTSRTELIKR